MIRKPSGHEPGMRFRSKGKGPGEGKEKALYFHDEVAPAMERLRKPVDELEMIVDKEVWPMPSYGDLIFEV